MPGCFSPKTQQYCIGGEMASDRDRTFARRCLVMAAGPVLAQNGVDLQGLFQLEYHANANASAVQAQNGAPNPGYTGDDWSTVNAGAAGTSCPSGTVCTVRT